MARLILDAMGGDYAPIATLEGALKALPELERVSRTGKVSPYGDAHAPGELVLLGDEAVIRKILEKRNIVRSKMPLRALRPKQNRDTPPHTTEFLLSMRLTLLTWQTRSERYVTNPMRRSMSAAKWQGKATQVAKN